MDVKGYLVPLKKISLPDRLFLVQRNFGKRSHIRVDQEQFRADPKQPVTFLCPARVYEHNEATGDCIVNFENCLECGACQVASRYVSWKNPDGGFGMTLKHG
jgi:ferredoxin like protein